MPKPNPDSPDDTRYTVASGSIFDGMTFTGIFEDREDALEYAVNEVCGDNWWVVKIEPT